MRGDGGTDCVLSPPVSMIQFVLLWLLKYFRIIDCRYVAGGGLPLTLEDE